MRIFIEGYDTNNWGDVLMATASAALASKVSPASEIVFPRPLPYSTGNYNSVFSELNTSVNETTFPKWKMLFRKPAAQFELSAASRAARKGDAILFCNGYIFGDPWREAWIARIASSFSQMRRRGVKIALMPASFGPFEDKAKAALVANIVDSSHLVFARDKMSYNYIAGLRPGNDKVISSVDYTGILNDIPAFFTGSDSAHGRIAIIPNVKIREKFGEEIEDKYVNYLAEISQRARDHYNLQVEVVVHTRGKDDNVAKRVADRCGIDNIVRGDPLEIRKFVGASKFVVTSRFHGLKNALSQNVPALALGWSHKYDELMRTYGMEPFSVNVLENSDITTALDGLVASKSEHIARLKASNERLRNNEYRTLELHLASALGGRSASPALRSESLAH
jgi:polysaccharide pyruvyl transferase WcaK-like protein